MPVRKRHACAIALAAAVLARSAVFVFASGAHFDADQAVTGLMGKHLSELRAFPVFWYGQTYMLGVEAWLAAPVMAVLGATVTALKLPLLAINLAVTLLLFGSLIEDARLAPGRAAFVTLFFALAAPITAAHYLTANGGNVEPCLYVLLLWRLRRRPMWAGAVLGVGFLNREFTIYGAVALVIVEAIERTLFARDAVRRGLMLAGTGAAVWVAVLILRHSSSAAGPGTTMADIDTRLAANNVLALTERLCFDPRGLAAGAGRLFTSHWPELFGLERQPLTDFGIESTVHQGLSGAAWLLVPVLGIPVVTLLARRRAPDPGRPTSPFCLYLMLVAATSLLGYLVGRCGLIDFSTMRYELLSTLGAAGLCGAFLRRSPSRAVLAAWATCASLVFALSAIAHARLIAEYLNHPPVPLKQDLIRALDARGIRYAYADYWTAYYVTFMTRERIVVAADVVVRIRAHNRLVDAHRAEAIRISRSPCPGGQALTSAFWACGT